jgi:mRNA deadenylase 3'-5' endonuclease subunit Ccr4
MSFRVATYNVLATAYVRPDRYPDVPPDLLDPGRRHACLVDHVEGLAADLLCLQEVEQGVFTALERRLTSLAYEGHYEKKGGRRPDGCATFFRTGVFVRRDVQRLDYQDGGLGHIALLVGLEHEGRRLGVANTHLRWDSPGTPRPGRLGLRQVEELLEACERFVPPCHGWLICGDFNATPDNEVVALVRQAGYEHAHAGSPGARSCVANGRARLIDYVFHSPALRAVPVAPPLIVDDTPLPSAAEPSDHLALQADVIWA